MSTEAIVDAPELRLVTRAEAQREVVQVGPWEFSRWEDLGDGEPRIRDTDAAQRLGYAEPRMIRKLIERVWPEGQRPNCRSAVERQFVGRGGKGVRQFTVSEYWLTLAELLRLVARSETKVANTILDEMIAVYIAVLKHLGRPSALFGVPLDAMSGVSLLDAAGHRAVASYHYERTDHFGFEYDGAWWWPASMERRSIGYAPSAVVDQVPRGCVPGVHYRVFEGEAREQVLQHLARGGPTFAAVLAHLRPRVRFVLFTEPGLGVMLGAALRSKSAAEASLRHFATRVFPVVREGAALPTSPGSGLLSFAPPARAGITMPGGSLSLREKKRRGDEARAVLKRVRAEPTFADCTRADHSLANFALEFYSWGLPTTVNVRLEDAARRCLEGARRQREARRPGESESALLVYAEVRDALGGAK